MREEDIKSICRDIEHLPIEGCYLITGASGFIGGYLVQALLDLADCGRNIQVIALVRNVEKAEQKFGTSRHLKLMVWDMTNILELKESFDYVIHAASPLGSNFFKHRPYDTMRQNFMGCMNLLDICQIKKPRKVLYVGTASSYGNKISSGIRHGISEDVVGEFVSMKDTECYAISKLASEYLMSCAARQMDLHITVVRLFSVYGPDMSMQNGTVLADLFSQALRQENLVIQGDGTPVRNFGYITDIITGIFTALHLGTSNEVYNVGSLTENYSIHEFAEKIVSNHAAGIQIIVSNLKKGNIPSMSVQIPDLKKITSLGWQPRVSLDEGISRIFKHYKILRK